MGVLLLTMGDDMGDRREEVPPAITMHLELQDRKVEQTNDQCFFFFVSR